MLYNELKRKLGAETRQYESTNTTKEQEIKLSPELLELLVFFGDSIVFTRGAKFKTDAPIPVKDNEGYIDIDIIYGLHSDLNNIFLRNKTYKDQIDESLYTFGESGSGDQYCIDRKTGEVYYWHHEAKHEDKTKFLISRSLNEFIAGLVADDEEELVDKSKKIVSAKFDF